MVVGRHRTAAGGDRARTALVAVVVCSGPSSDPLSSSSTSRAIAPMGSTTGTTSGRSIVSDPPGAVAWAIDLFVRCGRPRAPPVLLVGCHDVVPAVRRPGPRRPGPAS